MQRLIRMISVISLLPFQTFGIETSTSENQRAYVLYNTDISYSISKLGKSKTPYSQSPSLYYGENFELKSSTSSNIQNSSLRKKLNNILNSAHKMNENMPDTILNRCKAGQTCYRHRIYSYKASRKILFGKIHLDKIDDTYVVRDKYCGTNFFNKDLFFDKPLNIGPVTIPNPKILNTEHLWPKGRFFNYQDVIPSREYPYEMKLTDLHHLFPTDSRANGDRATYLFGEVEYEKRKMKCTGIKLGNIATSSKAEKSKLFFEPPHELKGNIARALFYFAVKYELPINDTEESFLRSWHVQDPVDLAEIKRNNIIHDVQGIRNPFIDFPEIVRLIENF